jgi:hypothetical protein
VVQETAPEVLSTQEALEDLGNFLEGLEATASAAAAGNSAAAAGGAGGAAAAAAAAAEADIRAAEAAEAAQAASVPDAAQFQPGQLVWMVDLQSMPMLNGFQKLGSSSVKTWKDFDILGSKYDRISGPPPEEQIFASI